MFLLYTKQSLSSRTPRVALRSLEGIRAYRLVPNFSNNKHNPMNIPPKSTIPNISITMMKMSRVQKGFGRCSMCFFVIYVYITGWAINTYIFIFKKYGLHDAIIVIRAKNTVSVYIKSISH